jgi:pyruvate,water dikinase
MLEVGRRLVERGALSAGDDVFNLTYDEVPEVLAGRATFDVADTVARRAAEYEKNLTITPPAVVVGRFDPNRYEPDPVDTEATTLTGMGASAGVVEGPARVILRSGTGGVKPGEILVAPFTDPGWTPYFVNAAGIVVDMGGMLSHGSIIAREYGIPAVVNVGPATKIIKTGQRLRVDGDTGVVTIL